MTETTSGATHSWSLDWVEWSYDCLCVFVGRKGTGSFASPAGVSADDLSAMLDCMATVDPEKICGFSVSVPFRVISAVWDLIQKTNGRFTMEDLVKIAVDMRAPIESCYQNALQIIRGKRAGAHFLRASIGRRIPSAFVLKSDTQSLTTDGSVEVFVKRYRDLTLHESINEVPPITSQFFVGSPNQAFCWLESPNEAKASTLVVHSGTGTRALKHGIMGRIKNLILKPQFWFDEPKAALARYLGLVRKDSIKPGLEKYVALSRKYIIGRFYFRICFRIFQMIALHPRAVAVRVRWVLEKEHVDIKVDSKCAIEGLRCVHLVHEHLGSAPTTFTPNLSRLMRLCALCARSPTSSSKPKHDICRRCRTVAYCSKECQHQDWARHKKAECH